MLDLLKQSKRAKEEARLRRKLGAHEEALGILSEAIEKIETVLDAVDRSIAAEDLEICVAGQLADLYGIKGGTLREMKDYAGAAVAYDRGFALESSVRYGFDNSYNALNRLIVRILLHPQILADKDAPRSEVLPDSIDLRASLVALRNLIREQVRGARSGDIWAAGDLALIELLLSEETAATVAWNRFDELSPLSGRMTLMDPFSLRSHQ